MRHFQLNGIFNDDLATMYHYGADKYWSVKTHPKDIHTESQTHITSSDFSLKQLNFICWCSGWMPEWAVITVAINVDITYSVPASLTDFKRYNQRREVYIFVVTCLYWYTDVLLDVIRTQKIASARTKPVLFCLFIVETGL